MEIIRSVSSQFTPEQWVWCLQCHRFFQARDARKDHVGGKQGCAFDGCPSAGFGVGIHDWKAFAPTYGPWPCENELRKGLRARPEDDGTPAWDAYRRWKTARLNRDQKRRDEILGIESHAQGPTPFFELDLVRLATLLAEGFVVPDDERNDAPSAIEVLALAARHPQLRFHGDAFPAGTEEYGVSIQALSCELADVPKPDRAAVRELFESMALLADHYVDDADRLYAAWGLRDGN